MSTNKAILESLVIGDLELKNRVVMAPLTRSRANEERALGELHATYYRQRSGAGLIVSEATQISQQGIGYPATPGIHTEAQVAGWKTVTDAVHEEGGAIFLQLWHVGRISLPRHQPDGGKTPQPGGHGPDSRSISGTRGPGSGFGGA